MRTAVVGLGAMGAPMAMNLHMAGYLTVVWNRTPARAAALVSSLGVPAAEHLVDVANQADLIITCVSRDADVREVVAALRPALRGGTVVADTSTVSANTAKELAALLHDQGSEFLDCPVSGGVEGAKNATLAMMVGGDAAALERARPALATIAATIVHMGISGSGQATKAVNQIMAAGINQAVTEALAFGVSMELDLDKVIDVVSRGAAANWFLDKRGRTMLAGSYTPGFKLALHHKDLSICKNMLPDRRLPIVEMCLADYQQLMDAGHGEEDISGLYRLKREQQGQT